MAAAVAAMTAACLKPTPLPDFSTAPDVDPVEDTTVDPGPDTDAPSGCGVLGRDCPGGFTCTERGTCESAAEVWVPAGPFWMGCNEALDDDCDDDEYDAREVTPPDYFIDRLEVTEVAFAGVGDPTLPALHVTWDEARVHCEGLGRDLCTEAQWEKAARGGCEHVEGDCEAGTPSFPWGEAFPTCELAILEDGDDDGCGTNAAWPVGSKPKGASPYGALDMAGNAYEWVRDCYHDYYWEAAPSDGTEWSDAYCNDLYRVARGGSWADLPHRVRASQRYLEQPSVGDFYMGFRCCRWAE